MRKLKYSPDAKEKLCEIKKDITIRFGANKAGQVVNEMTKTFRGLEQFAYKGVSVEKLLGIPCDYHVLYVQHNYAFYRVTEDTVWIISIFNEKEDFMWKLFGIKTIMQETEDYWNE